MPLAEVFLAAGIAAPAQDQHSSTHERSAGIYGEQVRSLSKEIRGLQ
jgi:hypothetical protein